MLASLHLFFSESHTYKQNWSKIYFSSIFSQLECQYQSSCYSEQTCAAWFAFQLQSFKISFAAERYYTEYILRIALVLKIVLGIGILLGLVHDYLSIYVLNLLPKVKILPNVGAINLIKMRIKILKFFWSRNQRII